MMSQKKGHPMQNAIITGWGKCIPPAVLSNADLETVTETSDEWITTRSGIKERRISHVPTSELASVAALRAIAAAGLEPSQIDLVINATCTPDRMIPASASVVQDNIGAHGAGALDVNAACSGFIYGLTVADGMIKGGGTNRVVVVGAEKLSFWLDFTDRGTAVLFGDGAGAVVVEASDEPGGVVSFELGSDGSQADILCVGNSGTEGVPGHDRPPLLRMDGAEVFRRAVVAMGDASVRVVEEAGLTLDDVDLLIPHQANVRIIDATARRLKLSPEQVYVNIASYGNTSAATIPIALTEALEEGKIRPRANLVLAAFGGGLTWAAAVLKWGSRVTPIAESDAALPPTDATGLDLLQPNIGVYGLGVER